MNVVLRPFYRIITHIGFFVAFTFFSLSTVHAAKIIELSGTEVKQTIRFDEFEQLEDVNDSLDADAILRMNEFPEGKVSYTKNLNAVYWQKLVLRNPTKTSMFVLVEADDPHHTNVQAFDENGPLLAVMGMGKPFWEKEVRHKNFLIPVKLTAQETKAIAIKYQSKIHSSTAIKLWSPTAFISYAVKEYFYLGLFYGILLIMGLYNLFLFFKTKEARYIYYFIYILSAAFYAFKEDGLGFQFVWPFAPWFNQVLNNMASIFLLLAFANYARSMVDREKVALGKDKLWTTILCLIAVFIVVRLTGKYVSAFEEYWPVMFIIPFALLYYWVLDYYVKGQTPLRLFLIGFSVMFSSLVIQVFRFQGWLESNLYTVYVFNFSLLFEAVMFSYALGDKFRLAHEQKEHVLKLLVAEYEKMEVLKDQVNRELEAKVSERTTQLKEKNLELMAANDDLVALQNKLYKMNEELDKANWKLQKKVHNTTVSLIAKEKVSFEEFLKIYPDPKSCLKRLSEMKWQESFTCRKCNNGKYSVKSDTLARKCTRCKTVESVTANTLFHGLKFPLNKAWYLAYVSVNHVGKGTIEQLAEELEIGKNACAHFRKKVQDRMADRSKRGVLRKGVTWEEILLNEE